MPKITEFLVSFFLPFLLLPSFFPSIECRYPCLNNGEPMLSGQSGNEFRCECPAGYFGPFCEYQDTSQTDDEAKSPEKISLLFPHSSSSNRRTWESTFVNLLLCVFFLLLLPSLVIYAVRALYLFLKRCHSHYGHNQAGSNVGTGMGHQNSQINQNDHPTPPPQYWAAMADEEGQQHQAVFGGSRGNCQNWNRNADHLQPRQWPLPPSGGHSTRSRRGHRPPPPPHQPPSSGRRQRSESPVTEVTVQLPASMCRPIHGTRSAGPFLFHQTQSLTLGEFHELLLGIQRDMQTQQQMENHQHHQQPEQPEQQQQPVHSADLPPPPPPPPLEPPPNYDLALSSTCPLVDGI